MSYTINPNAKNRWARNAENTMDLSLETDASSVYLDNGRTLEQEIGEGSMVSNVATVDSAMSKIIDGTLDGAYESLVFKGKSLVNLTTHSKRQNINVQNLLDSNGRLSWNTTRAWGKVGFTVQGKPNSTYCIKYGDKHTTLGIYVRYVDGLSGTTQPITALNSTCRKFTTDTTGIFTLTLEQGEATTNSWVQDFMILEYQDGMENWDIPYFEGICDVKMPILRNVGKNLFNPSLLLESETRFGITKNVVGETIVLNGTSSQYHDLHFTPNDNKTGIVVKKGKCYKLTIHCLGGTSTPVLNPAVKLTLKDGTIKWLGGNIDLRDSNCDGLLTWFRICPQEGNSFSNYQIKLQLEESSTPTTYEDHKSNILRTSEEIVLREVNGVQDTYNPLTGEYVQRIKERVFNGSETWVQNGQHTDGSYRHICNTYTDAKTSSNNVLCDKMSFVKVNSNTGEGMTSDIHITFTTTTGKVQIATTKPLSELKTWLSQNPITVQYELVEPITTIIEPLTIPFAYQNGHIILESGYEGQSLLPMLEYSTVVNRTGQIESVAKTIQAQEKQLTMLEKMLIQNIINLDYNNTLLTLKNEMEEML